MHRASPRAPVAARRQHPGDDRTARSSSTSASARSRRRRALQAIDRAELLVSLADARRRRTRPSRRRPGVVDPPTLAAAAPYLQPLALSAATRKQASKSLLQRAPRRDRRRSPERSPPPLERLVRVRAAHAVHDRRARRRVLRAAPAARRRRRQLRRDLAHANWAWLVVCVVMSLVTYVAAAIGVGRRRARAAAVRANLEAQMASSFVNRVTPANVGGMALNVRFLQKAGVPTRRGGHRRRPQRRRRAHRAPGAAAVVFFAWAGQSDTNAFKIPRAASCWSIIAVVLALIGIAIATTLGPPHAPHARRVGFLSESWPSIVMLAHSPAKIAALFGGSIGRDARVHRRARGGHRRVRRRRLVRPGRRGVPGRIGGRGRRADPGGLGAMEAALVAGLHRRGHGAGRRGRGRAQLPAVTYWLPILPGWLSFHHLERRDLI